MAGFRKTVWSLLRDRATQSPNQPFTLDEEGRSLTYGEYLHAVERCASALQAQGIGSNTRVAWQLPTWQESLVLAGALSRLGAVQVPMLPMLRKNDVGYICGLVQPALLIVPSVWNNFDYQAMANEIAAEQDGLAVLTVDKGSLPMRDEPVDESVLAAPDVDAMRWIFCTSGTTANPKAAMHSDSTIVSTAFGMVSVMELNGDDVAPLVFPFTHIGGLIWLVSYLLTGCRCLLVEAFSPKVFPFMREQGTTVAGAGTPFFIAYLNAQREDPETPLLPNLRCLTGGGAPKPPEMHYECKRELGGVGIVSGYGLTECPIMAMCSVSDPGDKLAETEGRALPGMQIKIVDADGNRLLAGEQGEICVRGPHRCLGYLDESLNADAFDDDGYFCTGDLGRMDDDGWITITGRIKDIIIRKGENISAKKIEDLLYQHPKVADVAVIGLPDAERGELVCAVVQCQVHEQLQFDELSAFCLAEGLIQQEVPERLELVESMPRNASGKVLKAELKQVLGV